MAEFDVWSEGSININKKL